MQKLADVIFGGFVVFDAEHDVLKSSNKAEPVSIGTGPPRLDPDSLPIYEAGPPPAQTGYGDDKPKLKRAGWLGGWL